jgi:hypothetical protein
VLALAAIYSASAAERVITLASTTYQVNGEKLFNTSAASPK